MWGGPGVGKTYTAKKIAEALGIRMVSATFGEMQSPMPGEYERNLANVFYRATQENALLFFDECDGVIQSRVNMGQIMSAENNYLLQQLEQYEGIVIFATNRVTTLDEALERRLSLIVEVPAPDEEIRAAIWRKHLPKKMPLGKDVSVEVLAKFELTGGLIKNVVLNAARYAIFEDSETVGGEHFARAIEKSLSGQKAFDQPRETGHQHFAEIS
jgi:SpoVK/Ycf46/Vps4 family AAA+-type ATPase